MRHRRRPPTGPVAIPDDNAPLPPAHRPTRWTVRRGRAIAFALLGLALAASLASVYFTYERAQQSSAQAAAANRRLTVLEADLADRTRQRDAERDSAAAQAGADREAFRARFCEVLAELSTTFPNLAPLEQALHCAIPPATPTATAATPPATATPSPRTPRAAPPSAPPPVAPAAPSPARPFPASPSTPPSGPGLICGLLPPLC